MTLTNLLKNSMKKDTPMAKPSYKIIKSFALGKLDISGSTMDFMMYLSPYIDQDCRVNIPLEQAKYALDFQRSTLERAINEALVFNLLVKKGEKYYSRFHILTDGSSHNREYVQLLEVFTSAAVRNLTLREKRLFYYLVVSKNIGTWHSVHVEQLYRNALKKDAGVDYFFAFKEVADALVTLVSSGLIELELTPFRNGKPSGTEISLKKDSSGNLDSKTEKEFIEANMKMFFEYSTEQNERKKRTSLRKSSDRVIQMRIAPIHLNKLILVDASKEEFVQAANENAIAWNKIKSDDVNYIIGFKNELFVEVGETGLQIYRKCLNKYLKKEAMNILHYAEQEKMADYFMDFYILPEIKSILVDAAKQQQHMQRALIRDPHVPWEFIIRKNTYRLQKTDTENLLKYFNRRASEDHKVLLDADLYNNGVLKNDIQLNLEQWDNHFAEVKTIFRSRRVMLERDQEGFEPIRMTDREWRDFMYESAKKGLLKQKKKFWHLLEEVRESLLIPIGKPSLPDYVEDSMVKMPVKKVEFYNWLEERE